MNSSTSLRWTSRQVVLATLFVVAVGLAFWLLFRFREVLFLLFSAVVIGTAIKPAVRWLQGRGLPPLYGQVLIYALLLVLFVGFLLLVVPLILEQGTVLVSQLSDYYDQVRNFMVRSPSGLLQRLGFRLPPQFEAEALMQDPEALAPEEGSPLEEAGPVDRVARAFGLAGTAARGVLSAVAIILMSFYWTQEGDRAIRSLLLLFPQDRREDVRSLIDAIEARVGGYILGLAVLSFIVGGMALVAYLLIGLPNAFVLALFAGVMEAIPVVGPVLGALPAALVGFSISTATGMWVLVASALIQFIENYVLVVRVMGRSVGVHPLLTLLALAAFSSLLGLAGALLAIPLAAVIQLLINRLVLDPQQSAPEKPEGRDYLSYLRLQAQEISQDVRKQVRSKEAIVDESSDQVEDMIEAIANDLDRVLTQVNPSEENGR